MQTAGWIQFTLSRHHGGPVSVSLRRAGERWVATLDGSGASAGLGSSARAALQAVLEPFGTKTVTQLLADVALLEPSCRVLEIEREARG
jgi:hypothetical protein